MVGAWGGVAGQSVLACLLCSGSQSREAIRAPLCMTSTAPCRPAGLLASNAVLCPSSWRQLGQASTCSRGQHGSSRSAADWRIEHQQALQPDLRFLVHVLPLLAQAHLRAHAHCDAAALSMVTLMQLHLVVRPPCIAQARALLAGVQTHVVVCVSCELRRWP